jgi:asparagine synthase (glutamine-hydrolysing)
MCGICGVFTYGAAAGAVQHSLMETMSRRMAHRGPDDEGVYISNDQRLGLGFRRLSIIDLSPSGHQPMSNEDGRYWIVFNGEIYNHDEHRARLQARGHTYRGRSDTETILHLYEEHGEDCLEHLRGMFALAIWDEHAGRLFLARDRIGIKPLYYAHRGGVFLFASEIKALLADPALSPELDEQALSHYLTFMVPPAPLTLFKGVFKLPPGCRATIDRRGAMKVEPYWDPLESAERSAENPDECVSRVRALLDESVRLRMMSDVPIGAFLSGGIDSSSIAALMARRSSRPVKTFTVGYKDSEVSNELAYARQIAREIGADHHEVMIGGEDMIEYMPRLVETQDEPIADPVCVPLYYVSKLARDEGVKVVLVGEGSDELFCGYPWYLPYLQEDRLWHAGRRFAPAPLLRAAWSAGSLALRLMGRAYDLRRMLDRRTAGSPTFWGGAIVYTDAAKEELLRAPRGNVPAGASAEIVAQNFRRGAELRPDVDFLARMAYLELKHRLPELLLMRVDKITMSVSLEARVPFLDHRLVEAILPLSMSVKLQGQLKGLLKRAVHGLIPESIINRPKQGFPAPVSQWFDKLPPGVLDDHLVGSALVREGRLNGDFIRTLLQEHRRGRRDWSVRLWVLYNLSLWHARWIEGRGVA